MPRVLLSIFAVIMSFEVHAAINLQDFDAVIQKYVDKGEFSGTVLLAEDNVIRFTKGYGEAVREHQVPNRRETVFRIGSISKQFTAAAILKLQKENKLSVTDSIAKYLDVPESWQPITIHHLLTHTSGLPHNGFYVCNEDEWKTDLGHCLDELSEWSRYRTTDMLMKFFYNRLSPLDPAVIGQFSYSNVGYSVLAKIVEKLSDIPSMTPFRDHMRNLFDEAGLAQTAVDHQWTPTQNLATGYVLNDDGWQIFPSVDLTNIIGAGDIRSTVDDLFRWHLVLEGDELFSQADKELLYGRHVPLPGSTSEFYAYGWIVAEHGGKEYIMHGGDVNGYVANFVRVPEDGIVFIALGNRSTVPLAKMFIDVFSVINRPTEPVKVQSLSLK